MLAAAVPLAAQAQAQTSVNGGLTINVPSAGRSTCSLAAPTSNPKLTLSRDSGGYTWTSTGGTAGASAVQGDLPSQESVTLEVKVNANAILTELLSRIDDGGRLAKAQIVYKPGNAFASWTAGPAPAADANVKTYTYTRTGVQNLGTGLNVPLDLDTTALAVAGIKMRSYDAVTSTLNDVFTVTCSIGRTTTASN